MRISYIALGLLFATLSSTVNASVDWATKKETNLGYVMFENPTLVYKVGGKSKSFNLAEKPPVITEFCQKAGFDQYVGSQSQSAGKSIQVISSVEVSDRPEVDLRRHYVSRVICKKADALPWKVKYEYEKTIMTGLVSYTYPKISLGTILPEDNPWWRFSSSDRELDFLVQSTSPSADDFCKALGFTKSTSHSNLNMKLNQPSVNLSFNDRERTMKLSMNGSIYYVVNCWTPN